MKVGYCILIDITEFTFSLKDKSNHSNDAEVSVDKNCGSYWLITKTLPSPGQHTR